MRVLIIEDSGFMADSLSRLLTSLSSCTVVGWVTNLEEATHAAASLRPELVTLDLRIRPDATGAPAAEHGMAALAMLRSLAYTPTILVITSLAEQIWFRPVVQAGAAGFIPKDSSSQAIISAIEAVTSGHLAFSPAQLQFLRTNTPQISPREREVLLLLAEGWSNQRIGERLGISAATVRKHVEHVCQALNAASRGEAVAIARREGLLD